MLSFKNEIIMFNKINWHERLNTNNEIGRVKLGWGTKVRGRALWRDI